MFRSVFNSGIRGAYNVLDSPTFNSDPWSVYPAVHKSTGRQVSVLIFDKSRFEAAVKRQASFASHPKSSRGATAEYYDLLKSEVATLAKLKHPQILTIYEVMEETKLKLLYVTEPVTGNLTSINIEKDFDELSIQKGLLQVSKGIQFLHNLCSMVHFNIQPSSIVINDQGDWKLTGFRFLKNLTELSPSDRENYYVMSNASLIPYADLNLSFTAPELMIENGLAQKLSFANDIWSLGCLVYYLYNNGDLLIQPYEQNSISDYKQEFKRFEAKFYGHRSSSLRPVLKGVPEKMFSTLSAMLARYPHDRITIDQFIDSEYFEGSLIKAMLFVDEFTSKSNEDKIVFLEGLLASDESGETLLSQFPTLFRTLKLLPILLDLIQNELQVSTIPNTDPQIDSLLRASLQIVFNISTSISSLTFQDRVYKALFLNNKKSKTAPKTFEKLMASSVGMRLVVVNNLELLQARLNDKQFVESIKEILTLVLTLSSADRGQQQDQIQLQESFLNQIPNFITLIDFPYTKNTLFPMLCQVFKSTTIVTTKLSTLETFQKLMDQKVLDKLIVTEQLFPVLGNVKSRTLRIVNPMLEFYANLCRNAFVSLEIESIVVNVIPKCFHLAFECNDCSQEEFQGLVAKIHKIQSAIVERKVSTLPTTSSMQPGISQSETNANGFDSLIQSQKRSVSGRDSIAVAPRSQSVLQPKVSRASPPSSSVSPRATNSAQSSTINDNRTKPTGSLKLNPMQPNRSVLKPAKSSAQGLFGDGVEDTEDDGEFDDFQSGSSQLNGIDWNAEIQKNEPMNKRMTQVLSTNTQAKAPFAPLNFGAVSSQQNLPPGFSSSAILTPNSKAGIPGSNSIRTNTVPKQTNQINGDLLDLI